MRPDPRFDDLYKLDQRPVGALLEANDTELGSEGLALDRPVAEVLAALDARRMPMPPLPTEAEMDRDLARALEAAEARIRAEAQANPVPGVTEDDPDEEDEDEETDAGEDEDEDEEEEEDEETPLPDGVAEADMLRLLAMALPPREAVWWACLSARDLTGPGDGVPECLRAAEAWVFQPSEATRARAFKASTEAKSDDDTALCATAATMAAGTMGPDQMDKIELPPGMFVNVVFGMVMTGFDRVPDDKLIDWMGMHVERGLDIARGGRGAVEGRI